MKTEFKKDETKNTNYISLDDLFDQIIKDNDGEEDCVIKITYVWCPNYADRFEYGYDEEYSFEGTKADYQKWKKDYFEFDDIDTEYVCYGDPNHRWLGHPDATILYLNDL